MESLFRFFKFLLIPIRVPFGTISMVTFGPLALGLSATAITVGTVTIAKFGQAGKRLIDPDSEIISNILLGGIGFLAAVANPFDELKNFQSNNFGALNNSTDFTNQEKKDIQDYVTKNSDCLGSDIEKAQNSIKESFPEGIPKNLTPKIQNRIATPQETITQLEHIKKSGEELADLIKDPEEIKNLENIFGEEGFKKEYEKLNFKTPFSELKQNLADKSPSSMPKQNLSAKTPFVNTLNKGSSLTAS